MTKKYLRFDNKFVGDVLDGKKKATIRKGEPFVDPGQDVSLLTGNGNEFGEAVVLSVEQHQAKELVNIDFSHHQNYSGIMDFKQKMGEYYDNIEPSTRFTVIRFRIKNDD